MVGRKALLLVEETNPIYPYEPAKLHEAGGDSSQRWYVSFYLYLEHP